ncbi:MAG: hypothetical protein K2P51_02480 [Rhabdochlamydiaceae bacterium]|nr:hypothetical protein [Rhabdochlamydiaceae bacterium]
MTTAVSAMRLFSVPPECPSSEKKQCSRELDCIQQQLLTKERVTLSDWIAISRDPPSGGMGNSGVGQFLSSMVGASCRHHSGSC